MDFTQGDVVLIKFPFSDGKGFKKRPALILQTFEDGDLLFCRITSKFYDSVFDLVLQDWSDLGLLLPSVVRIHKIIVLESSLIDKPEYSLIYKEAN